MSKVIRGYKKNYTKLFLQLINKEPTDENILEYGKIWWHDPRFKIENGLRLSKDGIDFLKNNQMEVYKIKLSKETALNGKAMLTLDKNIDSPYYIDKKYIYVTTQRKALEFILINGDIKKFISSKSNNKK